ncbi:MAG TPA: PAS domain S-box protein [bacterium]|nr:PAS domain S-box protein [bacterium]
MLSRDMAFLTTLLDSVNEIIFSLDDDFHIQFVNKSVTRILGYHPGELIGKNMQIFFEEQSRFVKFIEDIRDALLDKRIYTERIKIQRKDGHPFIGSLTISSSELKGDAKPALIGILRDVDNEVRAERALTQRNWQLATLSRVSSLVAEGGRLQGLVEKFLIILMQTLDLRAVAIYLVGLNRQKLVLYSHRGLPQQVVEKFRLIPFDQEWIKQIIAQDRPLALAGLKAIDPIVLDHMKKHRLEEAQAISIRNRGRVYGFLLFVPLISLHPEDQALMQAMIVQFSQAIENARLLDELRGNQAKYSALVEQANDGIMISQDGVFKFANKKLADMLGYPVSDMIGMPIEKAMPDEDIAELMRHYQDRISGDVSKAIYQARLKARDGHTVIVEFNAIAIDYEGRKASLSFVRDLSERIAMQNELLREKETATFFNDVLTHDVNNMMHTILGSVDLLADEAIGSLNDDQQRYALTVQRTARRVAGLIDQVRELMAIRSLDPSSFLPVELRTVVDEAREIVEDMYRDESFSIEIDVADNQFILANPLVKQLFVNLLSNAVRHNSKPNKWVKVTVAEDPQEKNWLISIEDNGDGISPEAREKLYQRYARFSKKEGLGLGMSIVKALIDVLHGSITIQNRMPEHVDEGARIVIHLPKA